MNSLLQTDLWAEFKATQGWQPKRDNGHLSLTRPLPLVGLMAYFPELPYRPDTIELIRQLGQQKSLATFVRLEFLTEWDDAAATSLRQLGLVKSFEEVQPEHRQWLDLSLDEAALKQQMHPKGRYNLNLAERHGLTINRGISPELTSQFYKLYQQTAQRTDFRGRNEPYFQALVRALGTENCGEVIVVSKDGRPLAAGIFSYTSGGAADYLYGGSGPERQLMAPYLLHWTAILEAKRRGCLIYDLLAIAPPDRPNHSYAGITRFKQQFGGRSVRLLGSWDLVNRPMRYKLYQFIERRRRRSNTT